MGFDSAYEAITEDMDDHRWAFGTGFDDPLKGVDTSLPVGVDGGDLGAYCLMLGDDALIMSHRLQQWLTRAPELEEETALANIALDLLGQARLLLSRAGAADGTGRSEDDYAYLREEPEFRNVGLVEGVDEDFGALQARLLVFSSWRLALMARLRDSRDPVLAAVAENAVKELTYHREYAADWVIRLGDGTAFSHARVTAGLAALAPMTGELFDISDIEQRLTQQTVAVDPALLREEVLDVLADVLTRAGLGGPGEAELGVLDSADPAGPVGAARLRGRAGVHTAALGPLLAELQSVARAHPGATW
jgi:ring-1,2-phenylacetyl-CoA epoxidase subunit PaaC